jgi:hypothetical protein
VEQLLLGFTKKHNKTKINIFRAIKALLQENHYDASQNLKLFTTSFKISTGVLATSGVPEKQNYSPFVRFWRKL